MEILWTESVFDRDAATKIWPISMIGDALTLLRAEQAAMSFRTDNHALYRFCEIVGGHFVLEPCLGLALDIDLGLADKIRPPIPCRSAKPKECWH